MHPGLTHNRDLLGRPWSRSWPRGRQLRWAHARRTAHGDRWRGRPGSANRRTRAVPRRRRGPHQGQRLRREQHRPEHPTRLVRPVGLGRRAGPPRIQGADVCGHVASVGSAVDPGLVGHRVLVDPWIRHDNGPRWRDHTAYLGSDIDGGFAEFCVVPSVNVFTVRSELSDVELATFACSWSAAENMLARAGLTAGERIAVPGASGGVGSALVQLAKLRGAVVTAITSGAKGPVVRAMGADEVIIRENGDVPAIAARRSGPFDVVADVVGGAGTPGWLGALRRGGRYVCAGAIAGPVVDLDLRVLYLNDLEFIGATVCPPEVFPKLVELIERDRLRPLVAATYPGANRRGAGGLRVQAAGGQRRRHPPVRRPMFAPWRASGASRDEALGHGRSGARVPRCRPSLRGQCTCVVSGVVGVAKPDREIFEVVSRRQGRPIEGAFYVDGSVRNVAAARDAAWTQFTDAAALLGKLCRPGLLD